MKIAIVGGGPGGLYFALLMKKAHPDYQIALYERNRPDDTFGFGVVFSDQTLDNLMDYDEPSYSEITQQFSYWDEIDFEFHGKTIRSGGHGFCGTERRTLLMVLQRRCRELGVELNYSIEIKDLERFADADLVVAADGINSWIREKYKEHFEPNIELRRNHFIWMGSTAPSPAFSFYFTTNEFGIWDLCTYQYRKDMSTWVIEAPDATWAKAEPFLRNLDEAETTAYLQNLWTSQARRSQTDRQPVILAPFPDRAEQALVLQEHCPSRGRPALRPFLHRLGHEARDGGLHQSLQRLRGLVVGSPSPGDVRTRAAP